MTAWYMSGTYDNGSKRVSNCRPHVVRGTVVTTLQRSPVQPGQQPFEVRKGEHVFLRGLTE